VYGLYMSTLFVGLSACDPSDFAKASTDRSINSPLRSRASQGTAGRTGGGAIRLR